MSDLQYDRDSFTFRYFDGVKDVVADPSIIFEQLLDDPEFDFLGEWMDLEAMEDKEEMKKVFAKIVEKVDQVFNLKPLEADGTGLARGERLKIVSEFLDWVNGVKKNIAVLPTRWGTSESKSLGDVSVKKPDLDSGSIEKELSTDEQNTSELEPT